MPVILATLEVESRRIVVQASLGIKVRPYTQNNESKKGWRRGSSGRTPL
jgi:hypothetical protein